jgi:hypothetical protein
MAHGSSWIQGQQGLLGRAFSQSELQKLGLVGSTNRKLVLWKHFFF